MSRNSLMVLLGLLVLGVAGCYRPAAPIARYVVQWPDWPGCGGPPPHDVEPVLGAHAEVGLVVRGGVPRFRLSEFETLEFYPYRVKEEGRTVWTLGECREAELDDGSEREDPTAATVSLEDVSRAVATRCAANPGRPLVLLLDAPARMPATRVLAAHQELRSLPGVSAVEIAALWKLREPDPRVELRYFADGRFTNPDGTPIAPVALRPDGFWVIDLPREAMAGARDLRSGASRIRYALGVQGKRSVRQDSVSRTVAVLRVQERTTWGEVNRVLVACANYSLARAVVRVER